MTYADPANQPQTPEYKPEEPFIRMAKRIDHNKDSVFAGAAVIVPPQNGGDVIEFLVLDQSGEAAQFWASVQTRSQLELQKLDAAKSQTPQGWGRQR